MTTRINNIDKFLRDLFQNFRVKPSTDSWNKIADALDNTNPKDALIPEIDEIGTIFKGYKVTPSENVWQNIYKILERDKFTVRKLSKSAVTAIVAFFSNTTTAVITSVVVVGGISLIILNPFKDDATKIAAIKSPEQVNVVKQNPESKINTQLQIPAQKQTAQIQEQGHSTLKNNIDDHSQLDKPVLNVKPNTHLILADNNKVAEVATNPINQQISNTANTDKQNPVISDNLSFTKPNVTSPLIPETKSNPTINENRMSRSPSVRIGINQNNPGFEKGTASTIDLQKNMDDLVDRFYRQWAKKFKRNRDLFYVEAYYMPIYGSTTLIAHQENSATLSRSYNEYLSGNPSSCLGINFGYNPNKVAIETGIIYEDRHTRRNDDLIWTTYQIKEDSIGFIFNTVDNTYHTIYSVDTIKNILLKQYRTRMSYQTIEIPLLIGYKLADKRNTIMIRTGILASFIFKSTEENSNIDESARPYIVYPERNKVDFAYVLNLSYDFNITDNFKISATPTLRYNITGMYKGYSINKGPITYGVGLGMRYIF